MGYYDSYPDRQAHQPPAEIDSPWLTGVIALVLFIVYVAQRLMDGTTEAFIFSPEAAVTEPWRWVTGGLVHSPSSVLHILLNTMALGSLGAALEPVLGRWRFLMIFVAAILGGHFAVFVINAWDTFVLGASGGIFGLFGALLITQIRHRTRLRPLAITIGVNIVAGFLIPGIAWEAHLGGLIAGLVLAAALGVPRVRRRYDQRWARVIDGAR